MGITRDYLLSASQAYQEARTLLVNASHEAFEQSQKSQGRSNSNGSESARRKAEQDELDRQLTKQQEKIILEKIKKLKQEGRLLPDSAMTTYFGKPAFHAYGNGNTRPASGGLIYGTYLKTHNINPHSGDNKPEFNQIYGNALLNPKVLLPKGAEQGKSPRKLTARELEALGGINPPPIVRKPQPPRQAKLKRPITGK